MGLLPEIENGELLEQAEQKLYTPPRAWNLKKEEAAFAELQNLRREKVTEDFSDSPHI